ncbi:MAG: group-specific protein [Chlamydiia bacterium]|nr:group-specific protein [Chlamydiia bacterium]
MKFYIATSLSNWKSHNKVRDALIAFEHEIAYDWTLHGSVKSVSKGRLRDVAIQELQGVSEADFLIVLLPGGHGTHLELGFGIAHQKQIFLHTEDPRLFELGPQTNAFYHHPDVTCLSCSLDDLPLLVNDYLCGVES